MGEGTTLLDFFDFISNSVIMPIVALLTCIFVGWIIKPKAIVDEVKISSEFKVEKAWIVIIKYVAPVLVVVILVAFVAQTLSLIHISAGAATRAGAEAGVRGCAQREAASAAPFRAFSQPVRKPRRRSVRLRGRARPPRGR